MRKASVREHADRMADHRSVWRRRNKSFYEDELNYLRFLIPPGNRILELGCGTGDTLAALEPSRGVGIDLSSKAIELAKRSFPNLELLVGDIEKPETYSNVVGPFDFILLSDTIGDLEDVEATLALLHTAMHGGTRVVVVYHSPLWAPVLKFGEAVGLKMPSLAKNWLWADDIGNFLELANFQVVRTEWRNLLPRRLFGLGTIINRYIATLPGVRRLCLRNYVVARSLLKARPSLVSASVIIPARNERDNIENAILRMPRFCDKLEIIFVEGHSKDGTLDEMHRVQRDYPEWDIKVLIQDGKGKADAVYKGFDLASGDVLMILDADLTVPPEALPKFWNAIASGKGEYIQGSRLIYPIESGAMKFLNLLANHLFSIIFTWLLNQRFTDTLCGTKVISRKHYEILKRNRSYFGDFDPFGDFDLIFGAVKQNLKVVEIPIRYANRVYGETQISRFRHGLALLRMTLFAFRKLKAF